MTRTSTQCSRRPRWVPDTYAPQCKGCGADFNLLRRRHHCRRCGNIFCNECSKQRVTLPEEMGYGSSPQRICHNCTPNLPLPRRPEGPPKGVVPSLAVRVPVARSPIQSPVPHRAILKRKDGCSQSGRSSPYSPKRSPKQVSLSPILDAVGGRHDGASGRSSPAVRVLPWTPDQSPRIPEATPQAVGREDGEEAAVVGAEESAGRGAIEREWVEGVWRAQEAGTRRLLECSKKHMQEYHAAQIAAGAPSLSILGPTPTNSPQSPCPLYNVEGIVMSPAHSPSQHRGGLAPSLRAPSSASPMSQKGRLSADRSVGPSKGSVRTGSVRGRVTSGGSTRSGHSSMSRASSSPSYRTSPAGRPLRAP